MGKQKARKHNKKGNSSKKQRHGGSPSSKDQHRAATTAAPRRSGRKAAKRKHSNVSASSSVDDEKLREAVEGDGTRTILDMDSDGNCLFRSLSDQLYHDFGNRYEEVRHDVCDFLQANENDFKGFLLLEDEDEDEAKGGGSSKATSACSVDEDAVADFNAYVAKMRQDGEWGGHLELQAASRMYRRNINVFSANMVSYTIEHGSGKRSAGPDLHVSFHGNEHYNSVRLNSASKPPPPPLKTFDKKATSSLVDKMEDEREAMEVADDMEEDTTDDKSVDPDESTSEAPRMLDAGEEDSEGYPKTNSRPKNNSPCTCGSGVRYKKCCKEKDKHTARLNRMGLTIQGSLDAEEETFDQEMDGEFRVLKI